LAQERLLQPLLHPARSDRVGGSVRAAAQPVSDPSNYRISPLLHPQLQVARDRSCQILIRGGLDRATAAVQTQCSSQACNENETPHVRSPSLVAASWTSSSSTKSPLRSKTMRLAILTALSSTGELKYCGKFVMWIRSHIRLESHDV
jgi:hypothetical protein